jgi:predicted DNA-binding transcriptional regulator YafY
MPFAENKAARLSEIEALLLDHPEGLTKAQIASRMGVHRTTIHRNLADLKAPVYEEEGRLFINREAYLVNLHLNLHEALSIHLAGRLMATRLDRQNPHAASAFRKLGLALAPLAPQISQFVRSSANSFDNESKMQDPRYLQVLEKLTLAWAKRQKVHLWYRGAQGGAIKEYLFCPFFIEVNAVGQAIYSIGQIEPDKKKRTFKVERVERIEVLNENYEIPSDFDPERLLGSAWGIWYSDQEPVEVVLKFNTRVAARVKETRWFPAQQVSEQADGSLIWRAFIDEPREMLPFVRGWGADVEVLEPDWMRKRLIEEVEEMRKVYQIP